MLWFNSIVLEYQHGISQFAPWLSTWLSASICCSSNTRWVVFHICHGFMSPHMHSWGIKNSTPWFESNSWRKSPKRGVSAPKSTPMVGCGLSVSSRCSDPKRTSHNKDAYTRIWCANLSKRTIILVFCIVQWARSIYVGGWQHWHASYS